MVFDCSFWQTRLVGKKRYVTSCRAWHRQISYGLQLKKKCSPLDYLPKFGIGEGGMANLQNPFLTKSWPIKNQLKIGFDSKNRIMKFHQGVTQLFEMRSGFVQLRYTMKFKNLCSNTIKIIWL